MRVIALFGLTLISTVLLPACSTIAATTRVEKQYPPADCSEMEGYGDCQDGRLLVPAPATLLSNRTAD